MKKGFTLIELLVVITILAILAGAALPYVQNYVEESRIAKAKTDLEEIARALAVYETREGEYLKSTVEDLTGRYLNKSPIDPWGKQYIVDPLSGTVYSAGPDRLDLVAADKLDNINFPYQPPLALVSVKWVDKNQSGAVDIQNVPDQIQLNFSRKLANIVTDFDTALAVDTIIFNVRVDGVDTNMSAVVDPTTANIVSERTIVYDVVAADVFTAGRDTINVISGHATLIDRATPANYSISDQNVVILPQ